MTPKRTLDRGEGVGKVKRARKSLSLETKLDILKRNEFGEGSSAISRSLNLPQSTVATVLRNASSIKEAAANASSLQVKLLTKHREPIMDRMEGLLKIWIDSQTRQHAPLSFSIISEKALSIIETLKVEMDVKDVQFKASKGWFERFQRRSNLHNVKMSGEAASADHEAAQKFKPELAKLIAEKGYSAKQVINYDETGLYWKKMPSKTYISKEEKHAKGFKAAKDRVTLLLGGNAEGDLKLKPMLVYHSENPRALKGLIKDYLPVVWRANKKAWLTTTIHQDYFSSYLTPKLTEYASANNIANRFLLILDNAPSHPKCMEDWAENIEVVFLPPNTTSLIQPMDQTVIKTFKAYYQRRTMKQLINGTVGPDKLSLMEWWKSYNIKHAIDNIRASWEEVGSSTVNAAWGKLWPECRNNFKGFPDSINEVKKDIVRLSHEVGFTEVDEEDLDGLLESHSEPLSNEELLELERAAAEKEEEEENEPEPVRGLDIKNLQKAFSLIDSAMELLQEQDPNPKRSSNVANQVEQSMKIYRELYDAKCKKVKQSTISAFFKPVARPSTSPTGPSTSSIKAEAPASHLASASPTSSATSADCSPMSPPSE